jgi:putative colanic acid biosynthesis acetyltransferase WcaF
MPWKLEIGDYVWIGEEAFILNFEVIKIGNNVCVSQRAFLCGGNHDFKDPAMSYKNGPITLEDGSWIGAGCFIGPNVTIGADCIITAYSVATQNTIANSIYKGNPALFLKSRWK